MKKDDDLIKITEKKDFDEFLLEVQRENGWKKFVFHKRKTTDPRLIKAIVNNKSYCK